MNCRELQEEIYNWCEKKYPGEIDIDMVLGLAEEVGELCRNIRKERFTKQKRPEKICDDVGDIFIFLLAFCNTRGIDFETCISQVWENVKQRDYTKNSETGKLKEEKIIQAERKKE